MTQDFTIQQLAARYVDLWEAQVAAVFRHNWASAVESASDEQFPNAGTSGATTDQPADGNGDLDLERFRSRLAACAERVDAVDAETCRRSRTTHRGTPDS